MTDSRGKRLLIAAMVCLLALICVLSWGGDGRGGATASTQALENETLSIEVNGEGTLYIRGEGALTLNDMKLMMDRMQLKTNQVDDIVIGDGITEIGYNVINGYTYLQTLKLGAGMRVVNNGAIKSCTALVEKLGRDAYAESTEINAGSQHVKTFRQAVRIVNGLCIPAGGD